MVRVGVYSAPLPFDCHCCADFTSGDHDLVLQHLAERSHHDAHIEFIAANEALGQHEIDALNAFNLYKPPTEPSRAAKLLARITTTAAAAAKDNAPASKDQCLAKIPSSPLAIIGASGPSPSTPTNGNATAGEAKAPKPAASIRRRCMGSSFPQAPALTRAMVRSSVSFGTKLLISPPSRAISLTRRDAMN